MNGERFEIESPADRRGAGNYGIAFTTEKSEEKKIVAGARTNNVSIYAKKQ